MSFKEELLQQIVRGGRVGDMIDIREGDLILRLQVTGYNKGTFKVITKWD